MTNNIHCQSRNCNGTDCQRQALNGGITCTEVAWRKAEEDAARKAAWLLSDKRQAVAEELGDEPPLCVAAVGQSAERALLTRNKVQLDGLKEKKAALEIKAERFQKIIDSPGATEKSLLARIGEAALRYVDSAKTDESALAAAAQESMRLEVEKRAAASAVEQLAKLNTEIEMAQLRIEHVEKREKRLVDGVVIAELERLGSEYMRALLAYKRVAGPLFAGLRHVGAYKDRTIANLPRPCLDACNKPIPNETFQVTATAEYESFFESLASHLAANPSAKVVFPL
jgi:hypothetical protein